MNELRTNLHNLLRHANISENELARRTGVAQQIINRILSGENKNPKLATLNPLCNYFMISLSQLVGGAPLGDDLRLNTTHLGFQEIPVVQYNLIKENSLAFLMSNSQEKLSVDIKSDNPIFAIEMYDDSMDPKFPKGSILILEVHREKSLNNNFALIQSSNNEIEFRQFFLKNENTYKKCFNPNYKDYDVTLISTNFHCLGLLIQARTSFNIS